MSVKAVVDGVLKWIDEPYGLSIRSPLDYNATVTQIFGQTSVTGIIHRGVDQSVPRNTNIRAILPWKFYWSYSNGYDAPGLTTDGSPGGYGNQLTLRHDMPYGTFFSHYAHICKNESTGNAEIYATPGSSGNAGDLIAKSNSTGISSGDHLHWELRLSDNYTRIDPIPFIGKFIKPLEDEWYMALTSAGKEAVDRIFNDPKKVANLDYALALCEALDAAKPNATPQIVGSSLVTLGIDGRKVVSLLSQSWQAINRRNKPDGTPNKEVEDAVVLMWVRQMRQFIAKNAPPTAGEPAEPVPPALPPLP